MNINFLFLVFFPPIGYIWIGSSIEAPMHHTSKEAWIVRINIIVKDQILHKKTGNIGAVFLEPQKQA